MILPREKITSTMHKAPPQTVKSNLVWKAKIVKPTTIAAVKPTARRTCESFKVTHLKVEPIMFWRTHDFGLVSWRDEANHQRFHQSESAEQDDVDWRLATKVFAARNHAYQNYSSHHGDNHEFRMWVGESLRRLMENHQGNKTECDKQLNLRKEIKILLLERHF